MAFLAGWKQNVTNIKPVFILLIKDLWMWKAFKVHNLFYCCWINSLAEGIQNIYSRSKNLRPIIFFSQQVQHAFKLPFFPTVPPPLQTGLVKVSRRVSERSRAPSPWLSSLFLAQQLLWDLDIIIQSGRSAIKRFPLGSLGSMEKQNVRCVCRTHFDKESVWTRQLNASQINPCTGLTGSPDSGIQFGSLIRFLQFFLSFFF